MDVCNDHDIVYVSKECPCCKMEDTIKDLNTQIEKLEKELYEAERAE